MGKRYIEEERREALELAGEIGAAVARRLGINEDTLYGRRSREKERCAAQTAALDRRSEADLPAENAKLRAQLKQSQQDVDISQEALVFFAALKKENVAHRHYKTRS